MSSTLGKMLPSEYFAWHTQAMILQSSVHPSRKKLPLPANVDGEITELAAASIVGTVEAKSTGAWVTNFGAVHHRHEDLLLRINQINDIDIHLHDISVVHIHCFAHSIRVYWFAHARETLSVTSGATSHRFKACEGAPSGTLRVLVGITIVVQLVGRHPPQALRNTVRRRETLLRLRILCWCGVSRNMAAVQSQKRKLSSGVTFQLR